MNYVEIKFCYKSEHSFLSEVLTAQLSEIDFESFVEEQDCLLAYIPKNDFDEKKISELQIINNSDYKIRWTIKEIQEQNWNAVWEQNYYEPLIIADELIVRGSCHKNTPKLRYEILIDPKMSFGTGHHQTTTMMLREMFSFDFNKKKVLDMGCGTSLLAIFASIRGASEVKAIDIDSWAYENSVENIQKNNVHNIKVFHGDKKLIENEYFDIILANINKNILINDIPDYAKSLKKGGILLVSGFYDVDFKDIQQVASQNGLSLHGRCEQDKWIAVSFTA